MVEGNWIELDANASRPFLGAGGEAAVVSELLCRGATVAVPRPDTGDDILTLRPTDAVAVRIQVKSANAKERRGGYKARFEVPEGRLLEPETSPPLVYVFAVRRRRRWSDFLIFTRTELAELCRHMPESRRIRRGIPVYDLVFTFEGRKVLCRASRPFAVR